MVEGDAAGGAVAVGDEEVGVVCGHGLSVLCGCQACPLPGLAGVLRGDASFTNLDLRGRLEESCPAAKLSKIPSRTHSGKREEEKPQKRRKEKGLLFQSGGDGLSRFCWRKLCPQGVIFDGQTAQPPDLDGPSETGYLCGSFCWSIQ